MNLPKTITTFLSVSTFISAAEICLVITACVLALIAFAHLVVRHSGLSNKKWTILNITTVVLIGGDLINGFSAPGFNGVLFFIGITMVVFTHLLRFVQFSGLKRIFTSFMIELPEAPFRKAERAGSATFAFAIGLLSSVAYWIVANSPPAPDSGEFNMVTDTYNILNGTSNCPGFNGNNYMLLLYMFSPKDVESLITVNKIISSVFFGIAGWFTSYWCARSFSFGQAAVSALLLVGFLGGRPLVSPQEDMMLAAIFAFTLWWLMRFQWSGLEIWPHALAGLLVGACVGTKMSAAVLIVAYGLTLSLRAAGLRDVLAKGGAFSAALGLAIVPLAMMSVTCGRAAGDLGLLNVLGARGYEVIQLGNSYFTRTSYDQSIKAVVMSLSNRLSFQTVGEILVGSAFTVLLAILTYFPFTLLRRRNMQPLSTVFILACVPMYGILFWRFGNSSFPMYLLMPIGLVFYPSYFCSLWRLATDNTKHLSSRILGWGLISINAILMTLIAASIVYSSHEAVTQFGRDYFKNDGELSELTGTTTEVYVKEEDFEYNILALSYPNIEIKLIQGGFERILEGDGRDQQIDLLESISEKTLSNTANRQTRILYLFKDHSVWNKEVVGRRFPKFSGCVLFVKQFECGDARRRCVLLEIDVEKLLNVFRRAR